MFWSIFGFALGLKLLLIKSYRSTDFEVHRNWMAVTHSLPISKWYVDETSQWTLDYPPFFAYFEWCLSNLAKFFDPEMLKVDNLEYASDATVLFQRLSVILSDFVFAFGVKRCLISLKLTSKWEMLAAGVIFLCNVGLIFVDHIHFQYNGFLFGVYLLSIAFLLDEKYLLSCVLFASLLNLKHIFLYTAPVFGAYFLKFYCAQSKYPIRNFGKLLATGLLCFAVSFGPFCGQMPQVLSRLFPFKRGLTHAYWAPNFWALYNCADKILQILLKVPSTTTSNTGGLVQEYSHVVLPRVSPLATFALTGLFMLPCIIKLMCFTEKSDSKRSFLQSIVICSSTSFMFGWHVHEKAILLVLIPLSLLSLMNVKEAKYNFVLSFIGYFSLFPLLFSKELIVIKYSLFLAYILGMYHLLKVLHSNLNLYKVELLYLMGSSAIPMYKYFIGNFSGLNTKFQFLPLLLISSYCGVATLYIYVSFYSFFITRPSKGATGKPKNKYK